MRQILVPSLLAIALIAAIVPISVLATHPNLTNAQIRIDDDKLRANLIASTIIPNGGASGYGIAKDTDSLLVVTTHAGVVDSEDQNFIADPIWHTHFVNLGSNSNCGDDPAVVDITWQSPGKATVEGKTIKLKGVPTDEFRGTHSITGAPFSYEQGETVAGVVSFHLAPVFTSAGLQAVCVTDITPADDFSVEVKDD
jgi:hypothetical protein